MPTSRACGNGCGGRRRSDPRFGDRRLHALLRREGVAANHERVERLYRAEGLAVRRSSRKRVARDGRGRSAAPERLNQHWRIEFVSRALARGWRIRLFTVVGPFMRVVLAIDVDAPQPGRRMVRVLERPTVRRGVPCGIVLDNGPEPAGRAMDQWAYERGIRLRSIEPGKPAQNAAVEGFNGRLRDEGPNQHRFPGLGDVQRTIGSRRRDDDRSRPHGALAYRSSEEFRLALEAGTITRRQRVKLS